MDGYQGALGTAIISDASATINLLLTVDRDNTTAKALVLKKAGAGARVVAVLKAATSAANTVAPVVFIGHIALVEVDGNAGAITENDLLMANANAQGVVVANDKDLAFGTALQPSAAAGDQIWVMLGNQPHQA